MLDSPLPSAKQQRWALRQRAVADLRWSCALAQVGAARQLPDLLKEVGAALSPAWVPLRAGADLLRAWVPE